MHVIVEVERCRMARCALALSEEDLLAANLTLDGLRPVQPPVHGVPDLPVVRGIKLLLRKWRQQQPETVELHWGRNTIEQPVIVIDRDDFAARHITQLRQEVFGQIEFNVEALQPREHVELAACPPTCCMTASGFVLGIQFIKHIRCVVRRLLRLGPPR
jgi:hypothetical protein